MAEREQNTVVPMVPVPVQSQLLYRLDPITHLPREKKVTPLTPDNVTRLLPAIFVLFYVVSVQMSLKDFVSHFEIVILSHRPKKYYDTGNLLGVSINSMCLLCAQIVVGNFDL